MHEMLRKRQENEEGFTLIELMVVVLIIAILLAIAIPTFLGARERAQDRAAQSNLRNALTAEKVNYTDTQAYTDNTASAMTNIEPSLTYDVGLTAATKGIVYISVGDVSAGDKNVTCLSAKSAGGKIYGIADVATGASAGTYYFKNVAIATCDAAGASAGVKTGF